MLFEWYSMLIMPLVFYVNSALTADNTDYPGTVMTISTFLYVGFHAYMVHRNFWIGGLVELLLLP